MSMVCPFPTLQSYDTIMWNACSIISCQFCSVILFKHTNLGDIVIHVFRKHTTKTLRGSTLPCAPVSTLTGIHALLRVCIGNCTLMCVRASSRVTVITVTGLKYSSLGSSQGGVMDSRSGCVRSWVFGRCDVDILCSCCLGLQISAQWFCFHIFLQTVPLAGHTSCLVCVRPQ